MKKNSDDEIIDWIQNPKTREKGVGMMMNTYQNSIYWHIRRLLVDHEKTQDALQETFIKAYRNIGKFNKKSRLYTWLYRIATNEALQELNKIKKMQKSDLGIEEVMKKKVSHEVEKDADEIQIFLQKAIQTLPEKQKLVFTMRYYDDLPYEEISQILDMSVGTLKTNYHYAKEKIEKYIKESYQ